MPATPSRNRLFFTGVLATVVVLWAHQPVYGQAQGATSTLVGQVTDETGAVIPGVELTLTNQDTNVAVLSQSNEVGYYRFSFLRPATYTLTAQQPGFTINTVENIVLQVNQTADINVSLSPSAVQETVTVSASTAVLSTQTSELGEVVAETPVKQLPLLMRDPSSLVNLVAGVTADHRSQTRGLDRSGLSFQGRLTFTANGGVRAQANAMVDGVDVTFTHAAFNSVPIVLTPDVTQEFQVMTNNYSAEFGRANVVMNYVTKSGTNEFHGNAYLFHQNDNLNANAFFLNRAGAGKTEARRNQFGGTLGGPIKKNKLWFFADWEKMVQARALTIVSRMPDDRELAGDYADLYTTAGDPINIYNPFDTYEDANGRTLRMPFPNNQIPAGLIHPFGPRLGPFWGKPNNPGLRGPNGERTNIANLNIGGASRVDWRRWDIKTDYQMNQNHKFMGRYSSSLLLLPVVRVYNTPGETTRLSNRNDQQPGLNAVLSWTWTASPTLMITQAFNHTWFRDYTPRVEGQLGFDVASLGGPFNNPEVITFLNEWGGGAAFPSISPSGYGPLSDNISNIIDEPAANYSYQVGFIKSSGSHTLKFGGNANRREMNQRAFGGLGGNFNFNGRFTNGPNPLLPSANTGNSIADLLLGLPGGGSMDAGFTTATKNYYYGIYFQDDWRVTPRLTLNLGVRFELEEPYEDRFDRFSRLARNVRSPIADSVGPNTGGRSLDQYFQDLVGRPLLGGIAWPGVAGFGRGIDTTDKNNIAPRLGFAYRLTDRLVMRGGFARIYGLNPNAATVAAVGPPGNGATTPIIATIDGIHPNVTIDNPWPNGFNEPEFDKNGLGTALGQRIWAGSANGVAETPYQWQWNFGFQYQMPDDSIVSLAYAGSRARNLTCALFFCSDQIAERDFSAHREKVFETVPNPFYGIINDPTSALSFPEVQFGQLLLQHPQYVGMLNTLPPWKGPNGDDFHSAFESMQLSYKKVTGDLSLSLAYTFSKNITNSDSFENGFLGPSVGYQNNVTFAGEKSLSAEDVTHRAVVGWVYELPVGREKRIGRGMHPIADSILGGWEVGGIMTLSSGFPIGRNFITPDLTGAFGGSNRSNLIGNPCLPTNRPRGEEISQWVNPAAFAAPEPYTFGNTPRTLNGCRIDGQKNFDITIVKHFPIKETMRAEFRAEFFNAFNRPQFQAPNMTFGSASFGQVTVQENLPRVIQLALKLHF